MSDLIRRQDAIDTADRADYTKLAVEDVKKVTDEVVKELKKLPSVDAVPVVRCKDCRHWDDVPIADERKGNECHLIDGNKHKIRIVTPSDWFCPAGERRSE